MKNIPEDSARNAHRISSARHLDFNSLMKEHFTYSGEINEARGRLLALFLFEKPFALSYEYRKKSSGYKKDKPILAVLIREGLIRRVAKTTKTITFQYIGPEAE